MLKIAICDRDAFICSYLEDIIKATLPKHHIIFEEFSNGVELYQGFCNNFLCDIILMDISFNQKEELSAISRIQQQRTQDIIVIYLSLPTLEIGQLSDIIDTHPFALIPKPIDEHYFTRKFLEALHETFFSQSYFEFKRNGETYQIPLNHILYIEKKGRMLNIVTPTDSYTTYQKIEDAYNYLHHLSGAFLRIQYSFIINSLYITRYSQSEVYIKNKAFSISSKYRPLLFSKYED